MQEEIKSADKAAEIAYTFLSKYYSLSIYNLKPVNVVRENSIWLVEMDVGLFEVKIARIKIDANTGTILEYIGPERR